MNKSQATERTRVRRLPARGHYDRETIFSILDEALVVHIGFSVEGQSYVIPTTYVRIEENLYIHGSAASRMLEVSAAGAPLCATVTLLDGLVFARSAFHHSMNYRSVVVLGRAILVSNPTEKLAALAALVDRFASGRSQQTRPPSALELKATHVLRLPIDEASAKVRQGPPVDDAEDLAVPCWAGVVPIRAVAQRALPEAALAAGIEIPCLPEVLRLTS